MSSLVKSLCLLDTDLLSKKFPFPNNKHKAGMDMISSRMRSNLYDITNPKYEWVNMSQFN